MFNVKPLGLVTRFNGMDVHQTKYYIKLTCEKYLTNMLLGHGWQQTDNLHCQPTPLTSDNKYITQLETATVPQTELEWYRLNIRMGFKYHQSLANSSTR
jgi:hypothetical protein